MLVIFVKSFPRAFKSAARRRVDLIYVVNLVQNQNFRPKSLSQGSFQYSKSIFLQRGRYERCKEMEPAGARRDHRDSDERHRIGGLKIIL